MRPPQLRFIGLFVALCGCACGYRRAPEPEGLFVAQWAVAPEDGTLGDGVETAAVNLTLTDLEGAPIAGASVCLAADDARAHVVALGDTARAPTGDANCTAAALTDAAGQLQAKVACVLDTEATAAQVVRVFGRLVAGGRDLPLYAPATITFTVPTQVAALVVSQDAAAVQAGSRAAFTVAMHRGDGTVATDYRGTVTFQSSDANAVLPAPYTFKAADAGRAALAVTFVHVGSQSLQITDDAIPTSTCRAKWIVQPAPLQMFALTLEPDVLVAGTPGELDVAAEDAFGNILEDYAGPVTLAIDGGVAFPLPESFTAGHLTHAVTLTAAGIPHSLHVQDANLGSYGELDGVQVVAGPPQAAALAVNPNAAMTYAALAVRMSLKDAYGNFASQYTGTVQLASSDPQAVFSTAVNGNDSIDSYTYTAGDGGSHTFGLVLKTINTGQPQQTHRVTLTADTTGGKLVLSQDVSLTPSTHYFVLTLTPQANSATAGRPQVLSVYEYDMGGKFVSSDKITAHVSSPDDARATAAADLSGQTTPFYINPAITFYTAGTRSVVVTDQNRTNVAGALTVPVGAASLDHYLLANLTANPAGVPQSPQVTAQDAYNNTVANTNETMRFTSDDPHAALPAPYTWPTADNGNHTFANGVVLTTAGSHTVAVADANGHTGQVTGLSVTPGPADHLSLTTSSGISTCNAFSATAQVCDAYANPVQVAQPFVVTLTADSNVGPLPVMGVDAVTASNGVATFGTLKLASAGNVVLRATAPATDSTPALRSNTPISVASTQPTVTLQASGASTNGCTEFSYMTSGVCRGVFSLSITDANSTKTIAAATQGQDTIYSNGTVLHGVDLGSAPRYFNWNNAIDLPHYGGNVFLQANVLLTDGRTISTQPSILALNNDTTFGMPTTFTPTGNGNIWGLVPSDLNHDGRMDFAYAVGSSLGLAYGQTDGTYVYSSVFDSLITDAHFDQLTATDLNHDGQIEIVGCLHGTGHTTNQLMVLKPGAGTSQAPTTLWSSLLDCRGVVAVDVNHDGQTDLVATVQSPNAALVWLQNSNMIFRTMTSVPLSFLPGALVAGDFNRDGLTDYVVLPDTNSGTTTNVTASVFGTRSGQVYGMTLQNNTPLTFAPRQAGVGDVNGDGVADIVLMGPAADGNIYTFLSPPMGGMISLGQLTVSTASGFAPFILGDANGDGKLDVVLNSTGGVKVWLGQGNGTFGPSPEASNAPLLAPATPLALADLNHDGTLDLLAASPTPGKVLVAPSVRPARCGVPPLGIHSTPIVAGARGNYAAAGDLNGDGRQDVVVVRNTADANNASMQIYYGDALGNFSPSTKQSLSRPRAGTPVIVDVDQDGLDDLLIPVAAANGQGAISIRLNTASGLAQALVYGLGDMAYGTQMLAVADLNSDGWLDIAATSSAASANATDRTSGAINVLLSTGAYPSFAATRYPTGAQATVGLSVTAANDQTTGQPAQHIAAYGPGDSPIAVLLNDGQGHFSGAINPALGPADAAIYADINGDHIADLSYIAAANTSQMRIATGAGMGAFASAVGITIGDCTPGAMAFLGTSGKVSNWATACQQGPSVRAFAVVFEPNATSGTPFGRWTAVPTPATGPMSLSTADIDGNGSLDLLILQNSNTSAGEAWLSAALATPPAGPPVAFLGATTTGSQGISGAVDIALSDIDGDGRLDAVVANSNGGVRIYSGNGDATFGQARMSLTCPGVSQVATGDIDQDSWPDVVVAQTGGLSVYTSTRGSLALNANFAANLASTPAVGAPYKMALIDVNGDGYLDLAVLTTMGAFYVQTYSPSLGAFNPKPGTTSVSGATGFAFADLDHSGTAAFVFSGDTTYILRANRGAYTYTPVTPAQTNGSLAVALADLDQDGNVDLAFITDDGKMLASLPGTGDLKFGPLASHNMVELPKVVPAGSELQLASLKRDGTLDAIVLPPGSAYWLWMTDYASLTWATPQLIAAGGPLTGQALGDLNANGSLDVVMIRSGGPWPVLPGGSDSVVTFSGG